MRCKCCDSQEETRFWKDDWYCVKCRTAILRTMYDTKILNGEETREEEEFKIYE